MKFSAAIVSVAVMLLCGCVATGPAVSKDVMGNLEVSISAPPDFDTRTASIFVDDVFVGNVSERLPVLYLKRGRHVIRVELEGAKTYTQAIQILGDPNHQVLYKAGKEMTAPGRRCSVALS